MILAMKKKRKPMKDLKTRLQSSTTKAFLSRFLRTLAEIPEDIKFFEKSVPGHALTCASVLHVLEMDEEERNDFLRTYLKKYEEIVREPFKDESIAKTVADSNAIDLGPNIEYTKAPTPKSRKKKQGI